MKEEYTFLFLQNEGSKKKRVIINDCLSSTHSFVCQEKVSNYGGIGRTFSMQEKQ